jgi:hypothetical protein
MRKFHAIAALCKDGLRPELQALFDCVWSKPVRPPSETALVVLVRADEPASVTVRSLEHCRRMVGSTVRTNSALPIPRRAVAGGG